MNIHNDWVHYTNNIYFVLRGFEHGVLALVKENPEFLQIENIHVIFLYL